MRALELAMPSAAKPSGDMLLAEHRIAAATSCQRAPSPARSRATSCVVSAGVAQMAGVDVEEGAAGQSPRPASPLPGH